MNPHYYNIKDLIYSKPISTVRETKRIKLPTIPSETEEVSVCSMNVLLGESLKRNVFKVTKH